MSSNRLCLVNHILVLREKYERLMKGSPDFQNELYCMACMSDEELKTKSMELDKKFKQPKKATKWLYE